MSQASNILSSLKSLGVWVWNIITNPYFLCFGAVLICGISIFLLVKKYSKWKQGWLSFLVQEEISRLKINNKKKANTTQPNSSLKNHQYFTLLKLRIFQVLHRSSMYIKNKAPGDIKRWYLPSIASFILICTIFTILFFLSHKDIPYQNTLSFPKWFNFFGRELGLNEKSNVIAIISGLTAIVFALVIFITESIRDSKNPDQKRVLLEISGLWFLVAFTTLSLFNFVWFKVTILSLVFPIIIGLGVICSFGRVIHNLLNPQVLEKNRIRRLKNRIKEMVLDSIKERVANNLLLAKVGQDKEIKLEYTFFGSLPDKDESNYILIDCITEGWISDVNFHELSDLATDLENSAQQLNFSIFSNSSRSLEAGEIDIFTNQSDDQPVKPKIVYLLKRYGEYILPNSIFHNDNKYILALPEEFKQDPNMVDYVKRKIPHIFEVKSSEPSSNIFRKELQGTKDQLIAAIKAISLGKVKESQEIYLLLAETFLDELHQHGGGYSADQALKERRNILEGWNEICWLKQDIRELIIIASNTDNQDIIADIAYLPIAIAMRAIKAKDHLLFQEIITFSPFIYRLAQKKENGDLKSFMIDRSWRYLKELSDYYIQPVLKDKEKT